jgi:N-acetyl-alpha-D-muramate 1-phosphate uridylyltransferase
MHEELARLGAALCRPGPLPEGRDAEVLAAASGAVVAIPAGGFGYRMRAANPSEGEINQKSLLPLPNGETLISRLVRQYAEAGFRRFVALVNYEGQQVEQHLGGGERWGVEIRYSYDPDATGSGRTGAMVHAMRSDVLPLDATTVVHNGDCHIMHYHGVFPHDLLRAHLHALRTQNAIATLAAVDGSPYPYTGMSIENGLVTGIEMYPFIPVPTHTGITVLTPEALESLRENAPKSKQNFERDMFPRWAAERRLASMVIGHEQWIAVDDRKAYRIFSQAVEEEASGEG